MKKNKRVTWAWTEFLTELAMSQIGDLKSEWSVIVTKDKDQFDETFQILMVQEDPKSTAISLPQGNFNKVKGQDGSSAQIILTKYHEDTDCDAFIINQVSAPKGFGPLLYDIALELSEDSGAMPDRIYVTKDAYKVWEYYMNSRVDVETKQLEYGVCPWEPGESDEHGSDHDLWYDSPLSKIYYKRDRSVIKSLTGANKMIYRVGDLL